MNFLEFTIGIVRKKLILPIAKKRYRINLCNRRNIKQILEIPLHDHDIKKIEYNVTYINCTM